MRAGDTFFGGIIAGGITIGVIAAMDFTREAFLLFFAVGLVSYIVARFVEDTKAESATRGVLIGLNSGLNLMLWIVVGEELFGDNDAGGLIGAGIGILTFLAIVPTISQSDVYQGMIGWANWLMPMSWLVVGLGLILFLLSAVGHVLYWAFSWESFRLLDTDGDAKTGTWFIKGGFVANLNPIDTAFNMGNFSFVDRKSGDMHIEHEAGHTLNLAVFGFVFHFAGAIDENVLRSKWDAYSEKLAESNDTSTSISGLIYMWAEDPAAAASST
jgi:MFS family permease